MLATYTQPRLKTFLYILLFSGITSISFAQHKIYVDLDATGGANDGTSWADAYTDLHDALNNSVVDDSIWVAQGTYYPSFADRSAYFDIPHTVYLYGGFDGTESSLLERDIIANVTTLSGDIDQDGIRNAANAYTVVYMNLLCDYSLLDGFVITGGHSDNGQGVEGRGGGVYIDGDTSNGGIPIFKNCLFIDNYAVNFGGAIYADGRNGGYAHYIAESCKFIDNRTIFNGGAIQNDGECSPAIINCEFRDNSSSEGAAIYNNGTNFTSSPPIVNCIFTGNTAQQIGGAIFNFGKGANGVSSPILLNCLIYDNTSDISAGGLYSLTDGGTSEMKVINSTFYNNDATQNGGHVYVNESNGGTTKTIVHNSIFWASNSGSAPHFAFSGIGGGSPEVEIDHCLVDADDCASMYVDTIGVLTCGSNMLYNQDPLFNDEVANDFTLSNSSPAVNYGDSTLLPTDYFDFDLDGDTMELVPVDLVWNMRIEDDNVDLGPYETNSSPAPLGALPVELISFKVKAEGGKVAIDWVTLSEENNDYFVVERSVDGQRFEAIHTEKGAGTTILARTYQVYDNNPFTGKSYYRLKQVDFDGQFEYSDIRAVEVLEEGHLVTYPNPVSSTLNIALSDFDVREVGFEIYHLSGKMMHSGNADVNEGVVVIELESVDQLVPGSYIVRIVNERAGDLYGKFLKVGL
ncbi:MAG: T9SS type A sorting domain-containing protein [Saprospiraceae bacterium]